jgi:hypothetical protein
VRYRRSGIPEYIVRWFAPMHAAYAEQAMRMAGAEMVETRQRIPVDAGRREGVPIVDVDTHIVWK